MSLRGIPRPAEKQSQRPPDRSISHALKLLRCAGKDISGEDAHEGKFKGMVTLRAFR